MYYFSSTVLLSMILFDSGLRKYGGMGIEALKIIKKKDEKKSKLDKKSSRVDWIRTKSTHK